MKRRFWIFFSLHLFFFLPLQCGGRVGVIGGGGAGLTTAWLIDEKYDVTLFEVRDRLGGHANTIDVQVEGETVPIEAGFEFISKKQFPHFFRLLNHLGVSLNAFPLISTFYHTNGWDTVILPPIHNGRIEWESFHPSDIFDMVQFKEVVEKGARLIDIGDVGITLGDFIENLDLCTDFKENFFYPFLAAGWGVKTEEIKRFAAYNALKYAVLGEREENFEWYEVVGGTQKYIQALAAQLKNTDVRLSSLIQRVTYDGEVYTVFEEDGSFHQFDHLVIATNAEEAAKLLEKIPEAMDIRTMLGKIRYFDTVIAIHGDERFMPPDRDDWRVVNIRFDGKQSANTIYKKWLSNSPVFKSWITYDVEIPGEKNPSPSHLYALAVYKHPIADLTYYHVQNALAMVQGNRNLWFAGNYTHDNDSHESAIVSAVKIGERLAPSSSRLKAILE